MSQDYSGIAQEFESLITSQQIAYDPQWQPTGELPAKPLVIPQTEASLGQVCAIAQQNQLSLVPCGNGSKLTWGGLPSQFDFYLSTRHLNQILDHAVGDLTVSVQAGVTLAQLQAHLKQSNQFLPLDPAYPDTATLGGIVATADAGSWRERYGGVRDLLIGISFVRADGESAKAGGRVVKNVAGYDLMKLFTGSYGTLGIISQLTFRTYPLPPASATVVLTGDADAITDIAQTLRNSTLTPTRADVLSPGMTEKLNLGKGLGLIIQWETIIESIEKQIEEISNLAQCNSLTITRYQEENEKLLWDQLKALTSVAPNNGETTCKIGLLPTAIRDFFSALPSDSYAIIHNKSGLGELVLSADLSVATVKSIRDSCEKNKGFLTLLSAPSAIKTQIEPWGYTGNALTIMKKIKEQFDPNNQFNPSRFVGGI